MSGDPSLMIDAVQPVELLHPLNYRLVGWWLPLPGQAGGPLLRNLLRFGDSNGLHGSLSGPTWGTSSNPSGFGELSFDGNDMVTIGTAGITRTAGQPLTASAWAMPNLASAAFHGVITNRSGAGAGQIWRLGQNNNLWNFGYDITGNGAEVQAVAPVNLRWTHICGVYDGDAIKLYVNGVFKNQTTGKPNATSTVDTLRIGSGDSGGSEYWIGRITDVRVYLRALSNTEVGTLYEQSQLGHPSTLRRLKKRAYSFGPTVSQRANFLTLLDVA